MNFLIPVDVLLALFALGKLDFSTFALVSFSPGFGVWVLPVETAYWIFRDARATWFNSGYMFFERLGRFFHIFYVAVHSDPEAFRHHSRGMEKRAQSTLLVLVALSAVRTLTLDIMWVRGRPVWSSRRGRKSGSSGTPWSSLPTLLQWYRSSTYQCRRWWTNWWTSSSSSTLQSPSRSSQCPRSHWTPSRIVRFSSRSWRNSWWKCRLP